jgi:Flp pilus assembly protein TadD
MMLHSKLLSKVNPLTAKPVAIAAVTVLLAACAQSGAPLETSSLSTPLTAGPGTSQVSASALAPVEAAAVTKTNGATTETDPASATTLKKAQHLRLGGEKTKALAVLDQAKSANTDTELMKERGMLALELGKIAKADALLTKVVAKDDTDWRTLSALGAAKSAQGKQPAAQEYFAKALALAPDHPSILNNMALSFALEGQHDKAEVLLRQAARKGTDNKKAKQNLALLLGLNGKIDDAKAVSEKVLPAGEAKANVAFLKQRKRQAAKVSRAITATPEAVQSASLGTGGASNSRNDQPVVQLNAVPN